MPALRTLTHTDLAACIAGLPPASLAALTLVATDQPACAGWFPIAIPSETVIQATLELIAYGMRCVAVTHRLFGLRPVPLPVPIMEYAV